VPVGKLTIYERGASRPLRSFKMMKTFFIVCLLLLAGFLINPEPSFAQPDCNWRQQRPYGGYCRGPKWGWYGARNPVKIVEEARKLLERYFKGENVAVGKITEHEWYFEAEIMDKKDNRLDRVIIDKRTGRIRSIY